MIVNKLHIKRTLIIIFVMFNTGILLAQQLPHFSQYYLNDYLINPAVAGTKKYFEGKSTHRYQWEGITDAPRTYTLSVNGPIKNLNMGIGGYLFKDVVGPTRRTGFNMSYAYHLKLKEGLKLSLGLSAGLLQFMIDASKINLRHADDPLLIDGIQSDLVPDAGFGLYLYHEKYYFGFSAPQLINSKVKFFDDGDNPIGTLPPHFFLTGGYNYQLTDDFVLAPSIFVKYVSPAPIQFEGTLRLIYQEKLWLSGTYRDLDAITVSLGYIIQDNFTIAYAYDITTTNLKNYNNGTHELMVGIRFHKHKETEKSTSKEFE